MAALPLRAIRGLVLPAPVALLAGQARAVTQLPRILLELNRSMLRLIDAFSSARETTVQTLATMAEVSARLERVAAELEEPLIALRPGLERLARVLDDEAVDGVPDTLRSINDDVLPLLRGLRDTQTRVNALATVLPGASLLFPRRPRTGGTPGGGETIIEAVIDGDVTEIDSAGGSASGGSA